MEFFDPFAGLTISTAAALYPPEECGLPPIDPWDPRYPITTTPAVREPIGIAVARG